MYNSFSDRDRKYCSNLETRIITNSIAWDKFRVTYLWKIVEILLSQSTIAWILNGVISYGHYEKHSTKYGYDKK